MNLPSINFNIQNGGLLQQPVTSDKVVGILLTGYSVVDKVQLNTAYQIFSLKDAENIGITAGGVNDFAYNQLVELYNEGGQGAEVWLMLVSDATTYTVMFDVNEDYATKLLDEAAGAIRVLGGVKKSIGTEESEDGLDADVHTAVVKAQALATFYATKFMPIRVLISGNNFTGVVADLKDYKTANNNRVLCLLSNTGGGKVASIGLALGRLARTPVQRNLGRVADGPVEPIAAYFTNNAKVETLQSAWDAIYNKGYTFLRSFVNKSGYFFTDDKTLTEDVDDFNSLARGLTMDKAVILCYITLVENLLDEIEVNADGKIHPAIVKSWQAQVEDVLQARMIAESNLSNASCYIDENQNILSTGKMNVVVRLQPVGYASEIEVNIGFTTSITN